ncbi:MAG: helix-turn-helix domain-containing protein [Candidatus Woesearchaeota archaeon]|nr:helix-turn-helix domain-containing protein [Candidatus Woesearchaeota archaeon]
MEHESLFTATKWHILKLLEEKPFAPIELAEQLNSSLANISQQLRLLEVAGVITSERISNREKGQPRVRYKLAGDLSYMIATTDKFVDKKLVHLTPRNKIVMQIWFLSNEDERYALEKAFWQIEEKLAHIQTLVYAGVKMGKPVLQYTGSAKLPATIATDGTFSSVTLQKTSKLEGHVLYAQ